jgi:hypothetical protein
VRRNRPQYPGRGGAWCPLRPHCRLAPFAERVSSASRRSVPPSCDPGLLCPWYDTARPGRPRAAHPACVCGRATLCSPLCRVPVARAGTGPRHTPGTRSLGASRAGSTAHQFHWNCRFARQRDGFAFRRSREHGRGGRDGTRALAVGASPGRRRGDWREGPVGTTPAWSGGRASGAEMRACRRRRVARGPPRPAASRPDTPWRVCPAADRPACGPTPEGHVGRLARSPPCPCGGGAA